MAVIYLPTEYRTRYVIGISFSECNHISTAPRKRLRSLALAVSASAVIMSACATSSSPANTSIAPSGSTNSANTSGTPVRLAYFPNLTHAVGLVAVARGTVQKAIGENNRLDVKSFNAGPALIEALLAGEVDIGYVGPNPAINGFVKSKGEALRIIAGASSGGALFIVRPEANIKTAKDLDGKSLASPQLLWRRLTCCIALTKPVRIS